MVAHHVAVVHNVFDYVRGVLLQRVQLIMKTEDYKILPSLDVVSHSLASMKIQVRTMRRHLEATVTPCDGRLYYKNDFLFRKRAALARRIIRLERIIKDMERLRLMCQVEEYKRILNEAA